MSRITDIQNPHERTESYISDSFYYTNLTESARTHMSNVCITDPSLGKGKKATSSRGQQIISKHNKFRFYLYPLIKGEQK